MVKPLSPEMIRLLTAEGPTIFKRLRCWFRRRRGMRHLYRKDAPWCVLCGHVRKTRKGKA